MRVCFVSQAAYRLFDARCKAPFGGAELQMYLLATELSKDADFDVHFLVQDYKQPRRQRFGSVTVWRYSRPLRDASWAAPLRWPASAFSTYAALEAIAPGVVIESPAGFPTAIAALWSRARRGRRFIYRLASDADIAGGISPFALERRLARWGVSRASALIAQNEHQREELQRSLSRDATILRTAFPLPAAPPLAEKDGSVLWVASSQELKRPDTFLDLAASRPHVRFVMVMPKSNAAVFARVSARAQALGNVEFSPGMPFDVVQRLFDRASVFVNTSSVEGFPNTFVQAAMAGTPVLSLEVDPDGVLARHRFGRTADGDSMLLSRYLDEFLADESLRRSAGTAGFEYARNTHDITTVIGRLKELIRSCSREGVHR